MQSFKGFGLNLLKLELLKDKALVRISFLQHIHHENRSSFNWTVTVNGELMFLESYGNYDGTNTVTLLL